MKKHLKSVISFVIALALSLSSVAAMAAPAYDDVPADAAYAEAVANLTAIGVVEGYGDGKFNPDGNITRAEVATMIVRALAQDEAAKSSMGVTDFTDLPGDHWAAGYVNVASRGATAFINGMGDGTFAPDANVTYEQVIKMLVAAIGYGDWGIAKGGYPTGYINTAKEIGITKGVSTVNGGDAATRAVVAQLINNAIDTPLLALSVYSPTNPEYVIMDGTKGNDYETILTYYHDIYKVSGRVTATNRSEASRIDVDKVEYQIEVTDNYDNSSIVLKKSDKAEKEIMLVGDTDVADYLNVYSKLLVKVTDDEDPIVLSCVASGKNVNVTLNADAWDDEKEDDAIAEVFKGGNKGQIWYYANSDKTGKSTRYYLSDNFALYVNGVNVIADAEEADDEEMDAFEAYVLNNTVGTVTLVDTPTADTNATDGKYDAIFVSYYATGIVDSVSGDKIYLSDCVGIGSKSSIEVDYDDEDMTYSFEMDGKEIEYTDLQEGDIVSIAYNPELGFTDTNFYNITVSRNVVEGKVTETSKDDNEITVNGETYKMVDDQLASASNFELGTSYTLYLDAFGHIADYEKLASSVKYGIISRAYYSNDSDEARVVLYDTTATKKTFTVTDTFKITKDGETTTVGDGDDFIAFADEYEGNTTTAENAASQVVEYTTNSAGELREIKFIDGTTASDEYSKKNNKIGSVKLNDATVVISIDEDDFKLVNIASLVDDTTYEATGFDKDNGTYSFVIITDGIGAYTSDTRFAVVEKVTQGVNEDGDECDKLLVYSADSKELKTVYTDGTDVAYGQGYAKGDVIVYKVNAAGVIEDEDDIEVIFENGNKYVNYAFDSDYDPSNWYADLISLPQDKYGDPIWDLDNDTEVEVRFGPVIDRSSKDLTLGEVVLDKTYYTADGDAVTGAVTYTDDTDGHKVEAIDFADDVAVYVYDDNNSKDNKLSVGTVGSIIKTSVSKTIRLCETAKQDKDDDRTIISLDADYYEDIDEEIPEFTYALVKIVDDEITDVFVIIPKD